VDECKPLPPARDLRAAHCNISRIVIFPKSSGWVDLVAPSTAAPTGSTTSYLM
jgi:hypothetical protein